MTKFLTELISFSLGGAVAVVVLALTARVSRARYAARWRCWLWLLLCMLLVVPVSIDLPQQTGAKAPVQITAPSDIVIITFSPENPDPPAVSAPEREEPLVPQPVPIQPAPSKPVISVEPQEQGITLYQVAFVIWAAGALAVMAWYVVAHLRFLRYPGRWGSKSDNPETIQMFNRVGDELGLDSRPQLLVCTGLRVPVLAGVFSPKLLLPDGEIGADTLRYSILHELTHYKRRDIWLKTVALMVNAVHWFTPVMWYMTRLVERDTELACDEAALKKLPVPEHKAYGATILDAVERMKTLDLNEERRSLHDQ